MSFIFFAGIVVGVVTDGFSPSINGQMFYNPSTNTFKSYPDFACTSYLLAQTNVDYKICLQSVNTYNLATSSDIFEEYSMIAVYAKNHDGLTISNYDDVDQQLANGGPIVYYNDTIYENPGEKGDNASFLGVAFSSALPRKAQGDPDLTSPFTLEDAVLPATNGYSCIIEARIYIFMTIQPDTPTNGNYQYGLETILVSA